MKFYLITRNENGTCVTQYGADKINSVVTKLMQDGYVEDMVALRGTSFTVHTPKKSFKVIQGLTVCVNVTAVEVV
ncbi:hypothetical protein LCGC14_0411410 [marine sediment metagenome]|uniref:Uncharacterized protein n=1 Tax=marine sediment metagenome TaxID=412755 RepID=A0A0F9W306_9ZZZZ